MKNSDRKFKFFVSVPGYHGFYVNKSNQTFCFGHNSHGQLNVGDKRDRRVPEIVEFFKGEEILDISVGYRFSVFRTSERVVSCGWGKRGRTSLGDEKERSIAEKVILEDEDAIVSDGVSVGQCSSFFLCSRRVYLAGSNLSGSRCYGLANNLVVGTRIHVFKTEIEKIVSGYRYALLFGKNEIFVGGAKRVGLGPSNDVLVKLDFFKERGLSLSSVVPAFSAVYFLCGNDVYISGSNFWGQYGNHSFDENETNQPVLSTSIRNIDSCASGWTHFVWRNVDERIFGTGSNQYGSLGLGESKGKVNVPTLIPMPPEVRNSIGQIAAGVASTYFISKDGQTIYGTGLNDVGELFNNSTDYLYEVRLLRTDLNLQEFEHENQLLNLNDTRNLELQRERLEFVLALEPNLKVKFNDSELEIFSCIINPESRLSRRIKDGFVEVNRDLGTTVLDTDLLHTLVFGADIRTLLEENIQNYLDFFLFFNAMGMRKHEYCLLNMVSKIKSLEKLVRLFVVSYRKLEPLLASRGIRDADIDQIFERQNVEEISFESNFTLNIFNTLAEWEVKEIEKEATMVKVLERLNVWGDLIRFKIRPLETLARFEDLQETTFNELFLEYAKILFRNRKKSGNYVVVSADEKENATHKEILCVKSDYFFKVIKFGGRETRKDGFLLLERLNYRELLLIIEFIYTREVTVQKSGDGLVVLMNVLEEIIPYDEVALQAAVEEKILKISNSLIESGTFLEDGLLKIGHFFSSTNRTLPEEVKKKIIEKLETKVEKEKLKEAIDRSALQRVKLRMDEEKKELGEKVASLEETMNEMKGEFEGFENWKGTIEAEVKGITASLEERMGTIEVEVKGITASLEERMGTIEAEMKEVKGSTKEILEILEEDTRKRKTSSEEGIGKRGRKKRKRR